jgi:hypothetical protein
MMMGLSKLFMQQKVTNPLSWATASVTSVDLVNFLPECL